NENGRAAAPRINGAVRRPAARARRVPPIEDCAATWNAAQPASDTHPYLQRKRVNAHGSRLDGDKLLLAARNSAGAVTSLQRIAPDGRKRFPKGTTVKGAYFSIGTPNARIVICEGFATGATIHLVTGDAVAVAFNCGNLKPVAKALRAKYPSHEI